MKVRMNSTLASKASKMVSGAISPRPVIAAGAGILLEASKDNQTVTMTATSGQYTVKRVVRCEVQEEGTALIDGKRLATILGNLPASDVVLTVQGEGATIKSGGAKYNLALMAGEFPKREDAPGDVKATINAGALRQMIETVKYAVSTNETRLVLTGIFMEIGRGSMTAVALDGFRMGVVREECDTEGEQGVVVPAPAAVMMAEACKGNEDEGAEIVTDGKALTFKLQGAEVSTVLYSGDYIEYKKIIPHGGKTSVRFSRTDLLNAIKRADIVSGKKKLIRVMLTESGIEVMGNDAGDSFHEVVPCMKQGEDMETAYNLHYVLDALSATNADEMQLDLESGVKAGVMKPVDGRKELHVVLPVRIVAE